MPGLHTQRCMRAVGPVRISAAHDSIFDGRLARAAARAAGGRAIGVFPLRAPRIRRRNPRVQHPPAGDDTRLLYYRHPSKIIGLGLCLSQDLARWLQMQFYAVLTGLFNCMQHSSCKNALLLCEDCLPEVRAVHLRRRARVLLHASARCSKWN